MSEYSFPFVGRRMSVPAFREYIREVKFDDFFWPRYVVLHHTWKPSLADRPSGLSAQHIRNLADYYTKLGWSGAPHIFVDDRPEPVIVFQRLDKRGIHAKSFNKDSWGVEMLGNYDVERVDRGRGAVVLQNAAAVVGALCEKMDRSPYSALRFHRNEPSTSKSCPGANVDFAAVAELSCRYASALHITGGEKSLCGRKVAAENSATLEQYYANPTWRWCERCLRALHAIWPVRRRREKKSDGVHA